MYPAKTLLVFPGFALTVLQIAANIANSACAVLGNMALVASNQAYRR